LVRCGSKNRHQKGIVCVKGIGLCAQNLLSFLGSIVNIIGGDLYDHIMSENLCFDNDYDIRMSSKNHEANGFEHILKLATILHLLCVWHPTRSRCTTESSRLRPAYLTAHMAW
jgi:hypothetical protein